MIFNKTNPFILTSSICFGEEKHFFFFLNHFFKLARPSKPHCFNFSELIFISADLPHCQRDKITGESGPTVKPEHLFCSLLMAEWALKITYDTDGKYACVALKLHYKPMLQLHVRMADGCARILLYGRRSDDPSSLFHIKTCRYSLLWSPDLQSSFQSIFPEDPSDVSSSAATFCASLCIVLVQSGVIHFSEKVPLYEQSHQRPKAKWNLMLLMLVQNRQMHQAR